MEKKKIESFEDLKVWQKGIELVKQIYLLTKDEELSRDFGLRDQLRRASISIPNALRRGKGELTQALSLPFPPSPLPFTLYPYGKISVRLA